MIPEMNAPRPAVADKVIIFTDGACSGNPGPGGWAAILVSPLGKVRELGGSAPHTTNNRMELSAAIEALLALSRVKQLTTKEIRLYTDSTYVIRGINDWVHAWKKRGWKTAAGGDVSNRDLWEALEETIQAQQFQVEWLYVPGHSGYPGNDRCDEIAVAFSRGSTPALYTGARANYPVRVSQVPPPVALPEVGRKKGPPVYLSWVNGQVHRDRDWKSCEARVKGQPAAKFKKVENPEEEAIVLAGWGVPGSAGRV